MDIAEIERVKARELGKLRAKEQAVKESSLSLKDWRSKLGGYKWVRYAVYLWGIRLVVCGVGLVVPILSYILQGLSYYLLYNTSFSQSVIVLLSPYSDSSYMISPLASFLVAILLSINSNAEPQIRELTWNSSFILNKNIFDKIKADSNPVLILKLPSYSSDAIVTYLSTTSAIPSTISAAKSSTTPIFKYVSHDRAWSSTLANTYIMKRNRDENSSSYGDDREANNFYSEVKLSSLLDVSRCKYDIDGRIARSGVKPPYLYTTHSVIPGGEEELPIERELSPIFPQIIRSVWRSELLRSKGSSSSYFKSNVWLSSLNITVPFHYDVEHNIFLQLHGEKVFTILEPSSFQFIQPYSILHPLWRQQRETQTINASSQLPKLIFNFSSNRNFASNSTQIEEGSVSGFIQRVMETSKTKRYSFPQSSSSSSSSFPSFDNCCSSLDPSSDSKGSGSCNSEISSESSSKNDVFLENFVAKAWRITLRRGDILYIPPYYLHQVYTVDSDSEVVNDSAEEGPREEACDRSAFSLSWSFWRQAKFSETFDRLMKTAELPFDKNDSVDKKFAAFSMSIYFALIELKEDRESFFNDFIVRYGHDDLTIRTAFIDWKLDLPLKTQESDAEEEAKIKSYPWLCRSKQLDLEIFSAKVRRTGMRLAKLMQGEPFSQINQAKPKQNVTNAEVQLLAIRRMLLYDYIDENVHSILSSSSSKAADVLPVVSSKDSLLNFAISCMYRSLESSQSQSQRAPTSVFNVKSYES